MAGSSQLRLNIIILFVLQQCIYYSEWGRGGGAMGVARFCTFHSINLCPLSISSLGENTTHLSKSKSLYNMISLFYDIVIRLNIPRFSYQFLLNFLVKVPKTQTYARCLTPLCQSHLSTTKDPRIPSQVNYFRHKVQTSCQRNLTTGQASSRPSYD